MVQMATLLLCAVLNASPVDEGKSSYLVAYKKAETENVPLVVVVGADWCAACKTLKSQTILPMKESGQFEGAVLAQIDKDASPQLAEEIMQGPTLPQIVVFAKGEGGWKRFSLQGIQTEGRVRELIKRAKAEIPNRLRG